MKFNRENNYRKQEIEGMQKINSEVLKEVKHTVDGSKNEIVYIDMDKIRPNSRNQYEMTEIEEMAGMIKLAGGILQNLIVKPMDEEGYYVLTTGERRWRGARLLRDRNEYPAIFDNKVPCVIQDPVEIELPLNDEDKEDFAILVTNQYRVKTDAILYMEMLQWKRIISNLKKAGVEYLPKEFGSDQEIKLKGKRTRELVAEQMNLSTGQVARFEKIEKHGSEELISKLMRNELNLPEAEELTKLDKEEVAQLFRKYDLLALPVLDKDGLMVGIVTFDDAMDVMVEEATEDITKMAAINPSEKTYFNTSTFAHAKNRIPWLLILMLTSIITGTIITKYEDAFAAIPLLVSFIQGKF